MGWRERLANLSELTNQPQVLVWLLLLALLACAFLMLALVLQASRFNRTLSARAASEDKDARAILEEGIAAAATVAVENLSVPPADRILPVGPRGFAFLVGGVAVALWLIGLALAPSLPAFLDSAEWRFQPLYIAAHLVTLRLFVSTFTKNFRIGAAKLDVSAEKATAGFRLILGPAGALSAALIALPFCLLDYRYLYTDRYARLGGAGSQIGSIDLVMWGIWCVEWFLNAFIWVVLVGFLVKNVWTIRSHPFRAPIETVLHEQHYRPFLQMSSQGAGVLFVFSIVTALYIYFTGGELTDYMGLGITGSLLVIGFVIPWLLLRSKVRGAVRLQTSELGSRIALASTANAGHGAPAQDLPSLARRLDDAVALLRISHLQRQQLDLGLNEAKAVLIRLLAPAVTIAWHYGQSFALLTQKAMQGFQSLLGAIRLPL